MSYEYLIEPVFAISEFAKSMSPEQSTYINMISKSIKTHIKGIFPSPFDLSALPSCIAYNIKVYINDILLSLSECQCYPNHKDKLMSIATKPYSKFQQFHELEIPAQCDNPKEIMDEIKLFQDICHQCGLQKGSCYLGDKVYCSMCITQRSLDTVNKIAFKIPFTLTEQEAVQYNKTMGKKYDHIKAEAYFNINIGSKDKYTVCTLCASLLTMNAYKK